MGDQDKVNHWPIYSLANYQGTGSLIEVCHSQLGDHETRTAARRSPQISSGYLTLEEMQLLPPGANNRQHKRISGHKDNEAGKGQPRPVATKRKPPLDWWQLVEEAKDEELLAELYGSRVLDLCWKLHKAVSSQARPHLVGSRSLQHQPDGHLLGQIQQQVLTADGETRCGSATGQRAKLRRLSWRRQVRPVDPGLPRQPAAPGGEFRHPTSEFKNINSTNSFSLAKWARVAIEAQWQTQSQFGLENRKSAHWSLESAKRGKYGESLIHLLIVNQTNEHLLLLVLLVYIWPNLAGDLFESHKFKGLGCLHLAVAYDNERLLKYLLSSNCGSINLEQRVIGSLFRVPDLTSSSSIIIKRPTTAQSLKRALGLGRRRGTSVSARPAGYWCDLEEHWPTANGQTHLLLFDRIMEAAKEEQQQQANLRAPVYLGETPLAWSVSFGSRSMYGLLAQAGANQDAQDSKGNTCLHQLVLNGTRSWARFLVKSGASTQLRDHLGFTPLLAACYMGRAEIFNEFLELTAVEFWSYSMISCCGYPLTQLDSIPTGSEDERGTAMNRDSISAMTVILESTLSSDEQKAQLLSSDVVKKLLEEKWRIFARRLFYRQLLLAIAHLALMTLSISLRPPAPATQISPTQSLPPETAQNSSSLLMVDQTSFSFAATSWPPLTSVWKSMDRAQSVRHLAELSTIFLSTMQLAGFVNEWRRYGNVRLQWIGPRTLWAKLTIFFRMASLCSGGGRIYLARMAGKCHPKGSHRIMEDGSIRALTYNPLLPNLVTANGLIVACAFIRLAGSLLADERRSFARAEDVLLIFAAPLLWSSLLFYIAAFRVTGPFVAMIRHMIVRDLRQFSLIYLVFLYSFAQCIFFVNRKPQVGPIGSIWSDNFLTQLLTDYLELVLELFHMTLGVYDLQPYRHSHLARLFFLLFIYLIPILFNMLIAMMNNTYSLIISQSERAWSYQWARTLFALERRIGDNERATYLRLYSINIPGPASARESAQDSEVEPKEENHDNKRLVPALMIIKRMKFTRAERRRLVLSYWLAVLHDQPFIARN